MSEVQWFPGHMNLAQKELKELVRDIDVVIELLDARAPLSSCNPLIQSIIKYKKTIKLLNKADLADPQLTIEWINFFQQNKNVIALCGNKYHNKQKIKIIKLCKSLAPHRNSFEKPLRVMITGIPNVGKSTLINQLINKKSAKTGDVPAVTRANQCLTLDDNFLIYDTPGLMWQKIKNIHIGYNLAICNSIGRNALDEITIADYLINFLKQHHINSLIQRYKLTDEILNLPTSELIKYIAIKRGHILTKGIVDIQKTSEQIIQDFREAKLGNITLETPQLWQQWMEE